MPANLSTKPLVGIPTSANTEGELPTHTCGDKYVRAVSDGAGCIPVLIPALGDDTDFAGVVARLDGVMLTGGLSNVLPSHYGQEVTDAAGPYDPWRDATVLPLVTAALAAGLPVLAICRGFQELNVALGGTLHPAVHDIPGRLDHRALSGRPAAERYAPRHDVNLVEGGLMARITGQATIRVNTLHRQGIDRLAPRLTVEATAPDGQIEAVRVTDVAAFALGVQWHPEWRFWEDPRSAALFAAFGDAVRQSCGSPVSAV